MNALGELVHIGGKSLPWSAGVQDNLEGVHAISQMMCAIWQKCWGFLEPAIGIVVTYGHDVVGHH